jgi:hypothetical protein
LRRHDGAAGRGARKGGEVVRVSIHREPEWRTVGTVVRSLPDKGQIILTMALDQGDMSLHAHEVNGDAVIGDYTLGSVLGRRVAPRFKGHRIRGCVEITVWGDDWAPGVAEATAPQFLDQPFKVRARL